MFSKKYLNLYLIALSILMGIFVLALAFTPTVAFAQENNNATPSTNWGQINAKIYEAQQITQGSDTVIVGVLDTGIQVSHPDIEDSFYFSTGSGCFYNDTDLPDIDTYGHGTDVAGIIASQTNGIAPNIKFVSLRASSTFFFSPTSIIDAIDHAFDSLDDPDPNNNISILNISLVGNISGFDDFTINNIKTKIKDYCNKGGLIIAAAGNEGINIDNSMYYPAAYNPILDYPTNQDNIITVGAINQDDTIVNYGDWTNPEKASNFGATSVDLFAPGTNIYTTNRTGGYSYVSGTSFAAPFVTGVAAMIKSINPSLSGAEIKSIILNNVDMVSGLIGKCVTGGKLNALKAVASVAFNYDYATDELTSINFVPNGELTILPEVFGNNIMSFGTNLFAGCTGLTKITIPSSVVEIGNNAFSGCTNLEEVILEQGTELEIIGSYAFNNCANLATMKLSSDTTTITGVIVPDSVTSIGTYAFRLCTSMTNVVLPEGITTIANYTFSSCTNLEEVILKEGIELASIGEYAFSSCANLETMKLSNDTTTITGVIVPDSVTSIGNDAFLYCTSMTNVVLPEGITTIANYTFSNCEALTTITIPSTVTSIGDAAFSHCEQLETMRPANDTTTEEDVVLPNGVTTIGQRAFFWCLVMESIYIPQTVTSIGRSAFQGCMSIVEITLPNNVTRIENATFSGCYALESITIPNGLTYIGANAFHSCTALSEINIVSGVETVGSSAFNGWTNEQVIHVYVTEEDRAGWNKYWAFMCNAQIIYHADEENSG